MYAQGIVALFPYLEDPYSQHGYVSKRVLTTHLISIRNIDSIVSLHFFFLITQEHFYDPESGSGYLAWRLKTIQRKAAEERVPPASTSPKSKYTYELNIVLINCVGRGQ